MAGTKHKPRRKAQSNPNETYVSTTVFRKKFGFSERYVLKLIEAGDLKAGTVPRKESKRKTYRIPMSEVTRYQSEIDSGVSSKEPSAA